MTFKRSTISMNVYSAKRKEAAALAQEAFEKENKNHWFFAETLIEKALSVFNQIPQEVYSQEDYETLLNYHEFALKIYTTWSIRSDSHLHKAKNTLETTIELETKLNELYPNEIYKQRLVEGYKRVSEFIIKHLPLDDQNDVNKIRKTKVWLEKTLPYLPKRSLHWLKATVALAELYNQLKDHAKAYQLYFMLKLELTKNNALTAIQPDLQISIKEKMKKLLSQNPDFAMEIADAYYKMQLTTAENKKLYRLSESGIFSEKETETNKSSQPIIASIASRKQAGI